MVRCEKAGVWFEMWAHERSMYVMTRTAYQTMHDVTFTNADKHCAALRASACVQGLLARSCRRRLVRLIEYRMCQRATAVDQPPFPPISDTTDNALDGVDVNGF